MAVYIEPPRSATPRDATFDILKGIGISEVIVHHLLSHSARKFAVEGSLDWWIMTLGNRVLHFAVPTFLLASALLLARSLASKPRPDWRRFYRRRAERTLWPYLVWSLVYIAFRVARLRIGIDVLPTTVSLPFGMSATLPALLADARGWCSSLLWGKAYFHLYFMAILLQFSVAFPLFYYGVRRLRLRFGSIVLLAALLQGGAFALHSRVLFPLLGFVTPASTVLWYLPAVLLGVWLGPKWSAWGDLWRAWRWPLALGTAAGFAVYMTMAVRQLLGLPMSSLGFTAGNTTYATGMALLLLAASRRLARCGAGGRWLARVGDWSLPLFLVHPLVLHFLSGPSITRAIGALPLSPIVAGILLFGATWWATVATTRLRVDRLLFGRPLAPQVASVRAAGARGAARAPDVP
ncbi:MAG: acyltransferase family protein [Chthonomonadales bacterium]|nr:acyltransferase family protein [Chthonomonadales bacterium]